MRSKSKNIAKTMEGCSKSHFSHIRNKVEKLSCDPSFWRGFWSQNRPKIKKKSLRNRYQNQLDFCIFFNDLGSILDPPGDPKILYFSSILALVVGLGPSWRQGSPQRAPR